MPTLFVKRLTVIDFSYLDAERGLVGESWQVDITLKGGLDQQGMVLDFGDVKKSVKRLIDDHFDHKLLIPSQYAGLKLHEQDGQQHLNFQLSSGELINHRSPPSAVTAIDSETIKTDTLTTAIIDCLMPEMPSNVESIEIHLWPEVSTDAFYHYSHGLKQHCGNCQRIAHGHRSNIEIKRNGARDTQLEEAWAEMWRDIYIGTREDLTEETDQQFSFSYESEQGKFAITLPSKHCYLIDTDSTVENLAQHIADTLKQQHPNDSFRVNAYEGVDKGAIGES